MDMILTLRRYPHTSLFALVIALAIASSWRDAEAATANTCSRCSHITDSVVNNNDGTWTYNYILHNDGLIFNEQELAQLIVDWELPYFNDAAISNIDSPSGWRWAIETIGSPNSSTGWGGNASWQTPGDPMYQGPTSPFTTTAQVLHWSIDDASRIFPGESLAGFSFIASFEPTAAPYQASWEDQVVRTGDPAFPLAGIPASPSAVPLPASIMLLMGGLVPFFMFLRRKPGN